MSGARSIEIGAPGEGWRSVIRIGAGLLDSPADCLVSPSGRFVLVSSAGSRDVARGVRKSLGAAVLADIEIDDREEAKTLASVSSIADAALAAGVRRDDAVAAVGGGVVCDIAGFAAAILLRGIAWNAIPTTTGAMADAAIGGKTGVDHATGKNLLGAFHPPRAILIDPRAAATLPDRDFRAGLVEGFKAAWIADRDLADRARREIGALLERDEDAVLRLLSGAVAIKAAIVSEDLKEGDRRRLLNFGHTLGHAFEAAGGYRTLRHGEAVAWGIAAAVEISKNRAGLSEAEAEEIRHCLARLGPFPEPSRDRELLGSFLARDKKFTARGAAGVLLESIGRGRVAESIPLDAWLDAAGRVTL